MEPVTANRGSRTQTWWIRAGCFAGFWLVLMPSVAPANLAFGAIATFAATWASMRLHPLTPSRVRLLALVARLPRFLWLSVLAGIDVARRAFSPSLPLNPGFIRCAIGLQPVFARSTFVTISSLMPGSLPSGDDGRTLEVHCLDVDQPIARQLAEEERAYAGVFIAGTGDD